MKQIDQNKANQPKELHQTWDLMEDFGLSSNEIDVNAAWKKFEQKLDQEEQGKLVVHRNPQYFKWVGAAAAVLLFVSISIYFFNADNSSDFNYVNNTTTQKSYVLSDNSTVLLDPNSISTFSFNGDKRVLELKGSGQFKIAKDEAHPFEIQAPDFKLVVLGTAFKITKQEKRAIHVEEGHVKIKADNKSDWIHLLKGESAHIKNGAILKINDDLIFEDDQLNYVIQSLEHKFGKRIILDSKLLSCSITGDFSKSTFEESLKSIAVLFKANMTQVDDDTFALKGGNCLE